MDIGRAVMEKLSENSMYSYTSMDQSMDIGSDGKVTM